MSAIIKCLEYINRQPSGKDVLSIIIEKKGSVPQNVGAAMVYSEDGTIIETIGGGTLEFECLQLSKEILNKPSVRIFSYQKSHMNPLSKRTGSDGKVKVLLTSDIESYYQVISEACEQYQNDIDFKIGLNVNPEQQNFGALSILGPQDDVENDLLVINVEPRKKLYIAGAGHCGSAIAELGVWLGFLVHLVDPRKGIEKSLPGISLHSKTFSSFIKEHKIDENTAVILVNSGHEEDYMALEVCIKANAKYIGMIGGKRKIKLVKRDFLARGVIAEEKWSEIHAPIGINIQAEKVKEIALSVLAEVVAVFNGTLADEIKPMKL